MKNGITIKEAIDKSPMAIAEKQRLHEEKIDNVVEFINNVISLHILQILEHPVSIEKNVTAEIVRTIDENIEQINKRFTDFTIRTCGIGWHYIDIKLVGKNWDWGGYDKPKPRVTQPDVIRNKRCFFNF